MAYPKVARNRTQEELLQGVEERRRAIRSWGLSLEEMETLIAENPHVYSPVFGFHAEYKCRQLCFTNPNITDVIRPTGYDRREKGDFAFLFRGRRVRLEVKSLDFPSVVHLGEDRWSGSFQCNASDAREVRLPNGRRVSTNCIVAGEWDILAVNLYDFGRQWRFAFARQAHLPRASSAYSEEDRPHLLASTMKITWPPESPFTACLDDLLEGRDQALPLEPEEHHWWDP